MSDYNRAKNQFERALDMGGKPTRVEAAMLREFERERIALLNEMEADRIAMRRAQATHPHRCHCPHCYVIGG